jgi:hypothetical protein
MNTGTVVPSVKQSLTRRGLFGLIVGAVAGITAARVIPTAMVDPPLEHLTVTMLESTYQECLMGGAYGHHPDYVITSRRGYDYLQKRLLEMDYPHCGNYLKDPDLGWTRNPHTWTDPSLDAGRLPR